MADRVSGGLMPSAGTAALSPIRVLIAEDEPHLGTILEQFMLARGFAVTMVRNGLEALEQLRTDSFDVALLDIVMPGADGLEVLRQVRAQPLPPEIIVITGNGSIETAIAALKLGAYDFLSKPYRMAEIEMLVRRAWEKRMLARDNVYLRQQLRQQNDTPRVLTQYAPLRAVLSLVERVAPSGSPALITGESGTGKSVMARLIHARSVELNGAFVELDCATVSDDALGRALFGDEGNAESVDTDRQIGALELATDGTIYLANVGMLSLQLQDTLLGAIASGVFVRTGGIHPVPMRARVVSSSSGELTNAVANGTFRNELLHRLSAIHLQLPSLRERSVDIALLAEQFVADFGGTHPPRLLPEAIAVMERYRWPGNVRELRTVIERAVLLAQNGQITVGDIPLVAAQPSATRDAVSNTPSRALAPVRSAAITPTLAELERRHIADVLERSAWHQGRAAELLGISPKTLYRKIREYGFRRPSGREI